MEAFIIGYMIVNKVAGIAMAVSYVDYLKKNGYFMQRKIRKWRSKKPYCDIEFWTAFNLLEEALKKAKSENKKNCISFIRLPSIMLGESFRVTLLAIFSLKPLFMLSKTCIVPLIKK